MKYQKALSTIHQHEQATANLAAANEHLAAAQRVMDSFHVEVRKNAHAASIKELAEVIGQIEVLHQKRKEIEERAAKQARDLQSPPQEQRQAEATLDANKRAVRKLEAIVGRFAKDLPEALAKVKEIKDRDALPKPPRPDESRQIPYDPMGNEPLARPSTMRVTKIEIPKPEHPNPLGLSRGMRDMVEISARDRKIVVVGAGDDKERIIKALKAEGIEAVAAEDENRPVTRKLIEEMQVDGTTAQVGT